MERESQPPETDLSDYVATPFRQLVREAGVDYWWLFEHLEDEVERRRSVATTGDNPETTPGPHQHDI